MYRCSEKYIHGNRTFYRRICSMIDILYSLSNKRYIFRLTRGVDMIIIVDYNAGNTTSVQRALEHLSIPCEIASDPGKIAYADKIIFPGVGHADSAIKTLHERKLDFALKVAFEKGTPILGICLGTQIILSTSAETHLPCLNLIPGTCPKFALTDPTLKIPHMGWDSIHIKKQHPVLHDTAPTDEFYFVHSFYPLPANNNDVYATGDYEIIFPAVIGRNNLIAMQFHCEKSGPAGLRLLKNFAAWDGTSW
jgi:imidazole glycerol-phosphate synthase subunit HisH